MKRLLSQAGPVVIVALWLALLPISLFRLYATDEVQYFAYLRSVYFDGDLDFANEYGYFAELGMQKGDPAVYNALLKDRSSDPPLNPKTGLYRNVAPVGSAILWSPWYVVTDGLGGLGVFGDVPRDGFSQPYIIAVCLASACYTLFGLLLSYRLARRWVGMWSATIATLSIWLASPLIWYTYIQVPWSHGAGFAMVALFITIWLGPADQPLHSQQSQRSWLRWLSLAIVGGLMTLTREQLGLFLLLPAVEGLIAYASLIRQGQWPQVRQLLAKHVFFVVIFALTLMPQLISYNILYGQPKPSGTVSGKLNIISYKFFHTLFDPRRGAFIWHPLLLVGLAGLIWLWRKDRLIAGLLGLGLFAQIYLNGAFGSTWHLQGSFGFRRLIECTPIFILGLALLIEHIRWPKAAIATLALIFIFWNGGLIFQAATDREIRGPGLRWSTMLADQLKVPQLVWQKADQLLFNRCEVVKNC
ncbi:hypothetical protein [Herpetosiphon sp. NSE202]|uniref:hypothetical protein n=1 Tax=Herpetosiphon sp. NSE202 TaxID=3351349 RepID=UPI003640DAE6